jgi:hypothetical protein
MAEHGQGQDAGGAGGGVGAWLLGIFTEPKPTFQDVTAHLDVPHPTETGKTIDKSKWWIPVLIVAAISIAVTIYTIPNFVLPEQATAIRASVLERGGTAEQAEQAIAMSGKVALPMGIIFAALGSFAVLFIAAGVIHLLMKMVGGKGKFRNARAVWAYTTLVYGLGALIKLPLMISKRSMFVETSPTLFFKALEPSDKLYKFLSGFDIFTIWQVVLLIIGLAVAYKTSMTKSGVIIVVLWLLATLLFTMIPGGAFGGPM